jgi:hypothetical protein
VFLFPCTAESAPPPPPPKNTHFLPPPPEMMCTDLAALVGESYERAYTDMVRVQQLTELEEVIAFKEALSRWGVCGGGG